jgi:hypothetical protein
METITLSKRGFIVFKRFVEAKFERTLEIAKEALTDLQDDEICEVLVYNNWRLEIDYCCAHHTREDCDASGTMELPYDAVCENCAVSPLEFNIKLNYRESVAKPWKLFEFKCYQAKTLKMETLLSWLDWVEENRNNWRLCRCGSLATMKEACDSCYIHSYVRPEEEGDCCVCHENDGRWVRLSCGHILHMHCFSQIELHHDRTNRKCPMCRQLSNYGTVKFDCYNV